MTRSTQAVLPVTLQTAQGDSSGCSFLRSRHTGNTHTLLVYSAGRIAHSPAVTLHPISPHRKSPGCSILLGLAMLGCAPQLMGLGKGRLPVMGLGMCQASECCTHSMHTSPGQFSQKSCLRCLCCTKIKLDLLGTAGKKRRAPPKVHPRGSLVARLPNRVLPTLPSVNGSCSSHSLPVIPSPGRKEEMTSGSHPGRPQEGSLWKGSPAAPCLHLPSELSPGCSPAVDPGLSAQLDRERQGCMERSHC